MKKLLAILLSVLMMLNFMSVFTLAEEETEQEEFDTVTDTGYTDTVDSEYEEAVQEITDLGIMHGYPDKTFRAKENITRAEFAVIVTRLMVIDHIAKATQPQQLYTDVEEDYWAAREIQLVTEKKYITGVGNSAFMPEEHITGEQAVKILVEALGYGDKAERKGGWTIGYMAVGAELGLVKDINFAGEKLTRGQAAQMLLSALYTDNSDGKTLLSMLGERIYYVSPNGSDSNPGTEEKPWKTLKKAANTMQAGSTAIFEDGTYLEDNVTTFRYSGREGAPITIKARNKHGAVIKYTKALRLLAKLRIAPDQSHINIRDFHFTQEETAKESDAGKTSDILLRCSGSYCEITGNKCTNVYEEGIKLSSASHVIVDGNIVLDTAHEGVDSMRSSWCVIRNNQFIDCGRVGMMIKGNTNNTLVYNNIVRADTKPMTLEAVVIGGSADGDLIKGKDVGFELYSSMFYNNVVIAAKEGLIPVAYYFQGAKDSHAFNNIAIGADIAFALKNANGLRTGWEWDPINLNPVIRNNIIVNCKEGIKFVDEPVNPTIENNLYYKVEIGNKLGGSIADPKFVDLLSDWHLQSGSPAINAGAEVPSEIVSCFDGEIVKIDLVDFDGNPRDEQWDIGIYNAE